MPIICKLAATRQGARRARTSRSPPTCWRSARSALVAYFPAKFKLRVLDPVHFDVPARPAALLAEPGHGRVRAASASRSRTRSTTCSASAAPSGSAEDAAWDAASSITGLGTFWGGRVAQALESRPDVDVIVGLDTRRADGRARAHRVRAQRRELLDPRPHREGDEGRHDRAHLPRRRLDGDAVAHDARDQRHRHDEPVRRGVGARQHRAQRRREVVDATSTAAAPGGPDLVPRGDAAQPHRPHPVERSLDVGRGLRARLRRGQPARQRHAAAVLQRARPRHRHARQSKALELPVVPSLFGFDPRFQFVHEDDVVRSILFVLDRDLPGIYNVAGDGLLPWSEVADDLRQAHRRRCRRSAPAWSPRRCGGSACELPAGAARPAALRPRRRQPPASSAPASLPVHLGRRGPGVRRGAAAAQTPSATTRPRTATSATSSSSSATPPRSSANTRS